MKHAVSFKSRYTGECGEVMEVETVTLPSLVSHNATIHRWTNVNSDCITPDSTYGWRGSYVSFYSTLVLRYSILSSPTHVGTLFIFEVPSILREWKATDTHQKWSHWLKYCWAATICISMSYGAGVHSDRLYSSFHMKSFFFVIFRSWWFSIVSSRANVNATEHSQSFRIGRYQSSLYIQKEKPLCAPYWTSHGLMSQGLVLTVVRPKHGPLLL